MEKVHTFEGHVDYIRSIAVHPTLPYILTCSDDMSVKLWDWEKAWQVINISRLLCIWLHGMRISGICLLKNLRCFSYFDFFPLPFPE